MELSIDTSTRYASAAISREGEVVMQTAWRSEQNHSVEFAPALQRLMAQAHVKMDDVGAVFVARGPGGFSALRVGISVAKALALARAIPLVAVGTLDVEAWPYLGLGMPVQALVPAGRTKVYAGAYGPEAAPEGSADPRISVETLESVASTVREKTLFCGEAVGAISGALRETLGSTALVSDAPPPTRSPAVLARLAYRRLQASDTDDPDSLQPLYMGGAQIGAAQRKSNLRAGTGT